MANNFENKEKKKKKEKKFKKKRKKNNIDNNNNWRFFLSKFFPPINISMIQIFYHQV